MSRVAGVIDYRDDGIAGLQRPLALRFALEPDSFMDVVFIPIERDVPTGPDYRIVCEVRGNGDDLELTDADHATARLIVAAPDLYAALERFTNIKASTRIEDDPMVIPMEAFEQARAALAKARGEQPA